MFFDAFCQEDSPQRPQMLYTAIMNHIVCAVCRMTVAAALLFALVTLSANQANAAKVLFWNIASGKIAEREFRQSLKRINSADGPDVVFLAEYHPRMPMHKTIRRALSRYRHFKMAYHRRKKNSGIAIYARKPFRLRTRRISIYRDGWNQSQRNAYFKEWRKIINWGQLQPRALAEVSIEIDQQRYHLFATHLINPWNPILQYMKKEKYSLPEPTLASWMAYRSDLPNARQAANMTALIDQRLRAIAGDSRAFLLGDFNAPDRVLPDGYLGSSLAPSSYIYGYLRDKYRALISRRQPTIPTRLSRQKEHKPSFMIDHVFDLSDARSHSARVLRWEGSDHYPVLLEERN